MRKPSFSYLQASALNLFTYSGVMLPDMEMLTAQGYDLQLGVKSSVITILPNRSYPYSNELQLLYLQRIQFALSKRPLMVIWSLQLKMDSSSITRRPCQERLGLVPAISRFTLRVKAETFWCRVLERGCWRVRISPPWAFIPVSIKSWLESPYHPYYPLPLYILILLRKILKISQIIVNFFSCDI